MLRGLKLARSLQRGRCGGSGLRYSSTSPSLFTGDKPFFITTPIFYVNACETGGLLNSRQHRTSATCTLSCWQTCLRGLHASAGLTERWCSPPARTSMA